MSQARETGILGSRVLKRVVSHLSIEDLRSWSPELRLICSIMSALPPVPPDIVDVYVLSPVLTYASN